MKWVGRIVFFLLLFLLIAAFWIFFNVRDRHPGYGVDLNIRPRTHVILKAGFGAIPINPELADSWTDANGDARYIPDDGDQFQDLNGNGRFDPVWLAGFHNRRPAAGIHDDLWARAMLLDDGKTRLAIVVLDAIGFGNDDVIDVRKRIPKALDLDYVIVCSTHTHEAPDLIGIWGKHYLSSGVDKAYREKVIQNAAYSIELAAKEMRTVRVRAAQDLTGATELVTDSRPPKVMDPGLRLLQFIDQQTDKTMGTLVSWANHPETTWSKNLLISSDFPHFVREGIEKGIFNGDKQMMPGLGGIAIYLNGAIGGLMTTLPSFGIQDPFADTVYIEPSFGKARAQGIRLALLGLQALEKNGEEIEAQGIRLRAKSIYIPMDNHLYRLAAALGVFDRGLSGWINIRTELALWQLGPVSFMHQPGELYPEILNGGVAAPIGNDFGVAVIESPPLRPMIPGKYKFVVGLSNDLIGYIVPKSQWDKKAPFTYSLPEAPYGEGNSLGPETAPIIYEALVKMINEL